MIYSSDGEDIRAGW